MDSVTHVVLGAALAIAATGPRAAVGKAAAWGGICGTLPDLDVLIDHGDAIRNMTLHRTETHALFYLSLASVPLAWLISRLAGGVGFRRWWMATWLCLVTHPLLDWLTIYGTQLALPFSDFPFAVGSVFVIDPLVTLPVAVGLAMVLLRARSSRASGARWNLAGLALATAYLAWSLVAQAHVTSLARASLPGPAAQTRHLLVVPTPFNTVLWRVLAMDGDSYLEGYYSLLDRDRHIAFDRHPAGAGLRDQAGDPWYVDRIAWFSHGFFRLRPEADALLISDLRMGQEPSYTFTFKLPRTAAGRPTPVQQTIDYRLGLAWLWQRMMGEPLPYPGASFSGRMAPDAFAPM